MLDWIFHTSGFVDRMACGRGWVDHPFMLLQVQLYDTAIFLLYMLVPVNVIRAFKAWERGRVVRDPKTGAWLFAGFTLSCGLTHLVDRLLFATPAYGLDVTVRGACALLSLATVAWLSAPDRYVPREQ